MNFGDGSFCLGPFMQDAAIMISYGAAIIAIDLVLYNTYDGIRNLEDGS